jgi:hypothetical protein
VVGNGQQVFDAICQADFEVWSRSEPPPVTTMGRPTATPTLALFLATHENDESLHAMSSPACLIASASSKTALGLIETKAKPNC